MEQELTIQDIAEEKKVSHHTVRRWIAAGVLKCRRYGHNTVRVPRKFLDEFDRRAEKR